MRNSLIVYTQINKKNTLLMGDAGFPSENHILNEYYLPKMDIIKVGHHGSKNNTPNELIGQISPHISLIHE